MTSTKNTITGNRLYRVKNRGFMYNRSLKQWELYEVSEDGAIQDLIDRVETSEEAFQWASTIPNRVEEP